MHYQVSCSDNILDISSYNSQYTNIIYTNLQHPSETFFNCHTGFCSLTALICWMVEYFNKLQKNVLTKEEVEHGWTSESRSQFGYSYYLVVIAFVLFLVNIFIVSLVQFDGWSANKKRAPRTMCEGVIMLY